MPRLDVSLVKQGLVTTRSQAENLIKLGYVSVDGQVITKPGTITDEKSRIKLTIKQQYVSRAALKLDSVAGQLKLDFRGKTVLDVGSSTGGFTDYALKHGVTSVIAVDVGSNQLHDTLRSDKRLELHEKTDIRDVKLQNRELRIENRKDQNSEFAILHSSPDIILVDVSFVSLHRILPHLVTLSDSKTQFLVLFKPQFEAGKEQINRGVIKNDRLRRQIIKDFENWVQKLFNIVNKADSQIDGSKGNQERFYLLRRLSKH